MDKNPLEDIYNTNTVTHTMINGRLYDIETMNEIGNYDKKRSKFYWENGKYNQGVPFFVNTMSFMTPTCSCRH